MGSTISLAPSSRIELRSGASFPFAVQTRLLRDGEVVLNSEEPDVSFAVEGPGVYRLEVYLPGESLLARDFPWIISNPIYVREDRT
jgi:hypothetical protein